MGFKQQKHQLLALILLAAYGIIALIYSVTIPAWEAPDEVGHYHFVKHLLQSRQLPVQQVGQLGENHQPPLYYIIAALVSLPVNISGQALDYRPNPEFMWGGQGGKDVNAALHGSAETFPFRDHVLVLHLGRLISVLMGLLTVMLTIRIGWEIVPDHAEIGLLAGALVAFNPQFLFVSSVLNNDNLLILATTGVILQITRTLKRPFMWQQWLYVGLWASIALLAKVNGVTALAIAGLAILFSYRNHRSLSLFLKSIVALTLPVLVFTGWWFIRNQMLYGDPVGLRVYEEVFAANLRQSPLQWSDIKDFLTTQFRSFWGVFGWMNLPTPGWHLALVRFFLFFSFVGLAVFAVRRYFPRLSRSQAHLLGMLGVAIVIQEVYMIAVITQCNASCYQGRYLFPVIAPMMLFISLGAVNLVRLSWIRAWGTGISLLFMGVALWMPFQVIAPAYQTPTLAKWELWFQPNKMNIVIGDYFELNSYKIRQEIDSAEITLYWQALDRPDFDYSVFVHLIDASDNLIDQRDEAPGLSDNYPPTFWVVGDILAQTVTFDTLPHTLSQAQHLRIGLYNWATGERLPMYRDGEFIGEFVVVPLD